MQYLALEDSPRRFQHRSKQGIASIAGTGRQNCGEARRQGFHIPHEFKSIRSSFKC